MNKSGGNPGLALAIASPLAFTGFNIGIRALLGDLSVWGLLFVRGCITVALVYAAARLLKKSLTGRNHKLLSLVGLTGFMATAGTSTAITLIPLYQALVILYLYPTFAIILSSFINKEKVGLADALGVTVALLGCCLLIWPDEAAGLSLQIGHLVGLVGSFCYGLTNVLARKLGDDNCGLEPIFYYGLFCAVCAVPMALILGSHLGIDKLANVLTGLGLGTLGSVGQLLCFAALRWLPAFKVGIIGSLEVFTGALASWLLFHDPMTFKALIGGALIIYAAFGFRKPRPETSAQPS